MPGKLNNQTLSTRTSALVITTAVLLVGYVELQALRGKPLPKSTQAQSLSVENCVRCHSDQKTIRMMRLKEDGGNGLFKEDGTFKDPKFAYLNPDYRHANENNPAPK